MMSFQVSENTRPAQLAGTWYPGAPDALKKEIRTLLKRARPPAVDGKIRALVVPHAGWAYSGQCAASAFRAIAGERYSRVVVMAPSHFGGFEGISIGDFDAYETPLGKVPVDTATCAKLRRASSLSGFHAKAHTQEHAIEVVLPFLQEVLGDFQLIPILIGRITGAAQHRLAEHLASFLRKPDTLLVASSDFAHCGAHFGYQPFKNQVKQNLARLDMQAVQAVLSGDAKTFLSFQSQTGSTICGCYPIALMLDLLDDGSPGFHLHASNSADTGGDDSNVVYYNAIAFAEPKLPRLESTHQARLLALARETICAKLEDRPLPEPPLEEVDPLREILGNFVTLRIRGDLRGCIGHPIGTLPLWQGIRENAISASQKDSRFAPLTRAEIYNLEIEISVLGLPIKIHDVSQIQLGRHGLYLRHGGHAGLLLPQVPKEMGWNLDDYLEGISRKSGLPPDGWKKAKLSVFAAQVFGEH